MKVSSDDIESELTLSDEITQVKVPLILTITGMYVSFDSISFIESGNRKYLASLHVSQTYKHNSHLKKSQHLPPTPRPSPPRSNRISTPIRRTSSPKTRATSRRRNSEHFDAVPKRDRHRLRVESSGWAGLRDVKRLVCVAGGTDVEGLELAGEGEAVGFPFVCGRVDEVLGAGAAAVAELGGGGER